MKQLNALVLVTGLALSTHANAWFFFFIPGSLTRAVGDAVTGAKGNICVKEGSKEGDVITSPTGNTAKILSVSGTSSSCPKPELPIRAELEFTFKFSSKAGIELSDDYEAKPVTDLERFNGTLLKASAKGMVNQGVIVSAIGKTANRDLKTIASGVETRSLTNSAFKEVKSQNPEQITIKGLPAVRWEIVGTLKGLFGADVTYLYTLIEGGDEFVLVNAYAPTSYFQNNRPEVVKIAEGITGLHNAPNQIASQANTNQQLTSSSAAPADLGNADSSHTESGGTKAPGKQQKSQALIEAQEGVADNPDNISSWNKLGMVYLEEQNFEKAIAAYSEALKRNSKNADALIGMGSTYNAMGNKDKVREIYFDLKNCDSKQAAAYFKKFLLP